MTLPVIVHIEVALADREGLGYPSEVVRGGPRDFCGRAW